MQFFCLTSKAIHGSPPKLYKSLPSHQLLNLCYELLLLVTNEKPQLSNWKISENCRALSNRAAWWMRNRRSPLTVFSPLTVIS